jgi:uncharacterized protein
MRLLLASDLHCNDLAARRLVARAADADVFVCAGDLAVKRKGLGGVVEILRRMTIPAVLVPGNGESDQELRDACADWPEARVLHGSGCEVDGVRFWGIGGGIPVTPFGAWSFDLSEEEARPLLAGCPEGALLVTHSPPFGHVDEVRGRHMGSRTVLEAVQRTRPPLVVCGHIHDRWESESWIGSSQVVNAGPRGLMQEVAPPSLPPRRP